MTCLAPVARRPAAPGHAAGPQGLKRARHDGAEGAACAAAAGTAAGSGSGGGGGGAAAEVEGRDTGRDISALMI